MNFILKFTTDIRYVQKLSNMFADDLSTIAIADVSLSFDLNYDALAEAQAEDKDLRPIHQKLGVLIVLDFPSHDGARPITCNICLILSICV